MTAIPCPGLGVADTVHGPSLAPTVPAHADAAHSAAAAWPHALRLWQAMTQHVLWASLLVSALVLALLASQPQLRAELEARTLAWLLERQSAALGVEVEPAAAERAVVSDPSLLPDDQERVADWLSRKYRVAKEPMSALVAEAYAVGAELRLDPKLILAVMAKESRFNPFAASPVGAQGLMQVMTRVHQDKLEDFGGKLAVFDPLTNLRVGALILRDTIRRGGSVEAGLRLYVGAVTTDASAYINAVLSERARLQQVALGQRVAFNAALRRNPAPEAALIPAPTANAVAGVAGAAAVFQAVPGVEAKPVAVPLQPEPGVVPEPEHGNPFIYSRFVPGTTHVKAAYNAYNAYNVHTGGSVQGVGLGGSVVVPTQPQPAAALAS